MVGLSVELEREGAGDEGVRRYVRVLVGSGNAMAEWMVGAGRYRV